MLGSSTTHRGRSPTVRPSLANTFSSTMGTDLGAIPAPQTRMAVKEQVLCKMLTFTGPRSWWLADMLLVHARRRGQGTGRSTADEGHF